MKEFSWPTDLLIVAINEHFRLGVMSLLNCLIDGSLGPRENSSFDKKRTPPASRLDFFNLAKEFHERRKDSSTNVDFAKRND